MQSEIYIFLLKQFSETTFQWDNVKVSYVLLHDYMIENARTKLNKRELAFAVDMEEKNIVALILPIMLRSDFRLLFRRIFLFRDIYRT